VLVPVFYKGFYSEGKRIAKYNKYGTATLQIGFSVFDERDRVGVDFKDCDEACCDNRLEVHRSCLRTVLPNMVECVGLVENEHDGSVPNGDE